MRDKSPSKRYSISALGYVAAALLLCIVAAGCSEDVVEPIDDCATTDKKLVVEVDRRSLDYPLMGTEIARWQSYSLCDMSSAQSSALVMASDYDYLYPEGPINVEKFDDDILDFWSEYMSPWVDGVLLRDYCKAKRGGNQVRDGKIVKTLHLIVGNYYTNVDAQKTERWNFPIMPSGYPFTEVHFGLTYHPGGCTFNDDSPTAIVFYDMCIKFVADMVEWSKWNYFGSEEDPTTTIINFSPTAFTSFVLSHEFAHELGLSDISVIGQDCHDDDNCICVMNPPVMNRIRYANSLNEANSYIVNMCGVKFCSSCKSTRWCDYSDLVPTPVQ